MTELRYNPLRQRWTMVASGRANRPQMPKDWCPFCPSSGKVPSDYEVYAYHNDFPVLSPEPPAPDVESTSLVPVRPAVGNAEVILFTPDHHGSIARLGSDHLMKLWNLWCERFTALGAQSGVEYVYIFENKGDVIGVTMPHPHGQLYAFPFIPSRIAVELDASRKHWEKTGRSLIADIREEEARDGRRIVFENDFVTVFLPPAAEFPYELHAYPKAHVPAMTGFTPAQALGVMEAYAAIVRTYNALFENIKELPYMMGMHQAPTGPGDWGHFHFHLEFYPLHRAPDKIKYCASSETGADAHCNPTSPEVCAAQLRKAWERAGQF